MEQKMIDPAKLFNGACSFNRIDKKIAFEYGMAKWPDTSIKATFATFTEFQTYVNNKITYLKSLGNSINSSFSMTFTDSHDFIFPYGNIISSSWNGTSWVHDWSESAKMINMYLFYMQSTFFGRYQIDMSGTYDLGGTPTAYPDAAIIADISFKKDYFLNFRVVMSEIYNEIIGTKAEIVRF